MSGRLVINNSKRMAPGDMSAVRDLVEALISTGVAAGIAGSSRPCSGSEHLFSHALDVISPGNGLHGEKCGIGTIMVAKLQGLDWRSVRSALNDVKAPVTADAISVSDSEVVEALVRASEIRPDRYTILSKVRLTGSTARELAEDTGVI